MIAYAFAFACCKHAFHIACECRLHVCFVFVLPLFVCLWLYDCFACTCLCVCLDLLPCSDSLRVLRVYVRIDCWRLVMCLVFYGANLFYISHVSLDCVLVLL